MEMAPALQHEDPIQNLLNGPDKSLEIEFDPERCCIYRVPRMLRRVNEDVYTPQLISIGPLHHGKQELTDMEKKKGQYVRSFFSRPNVNKEGITSFIKNNEEKIRACYAETSALTNPEFVKMILYDSIFIIEIFLRFKLKDKCDKLLCPLNFALWTDLQLFENQLPYFILEGVSALAFDFNPRLHEFAFDGNQRIQELALDEHPFMYLSINFFGTFMGVELSRISPEVKVKHFTDWRRISLLKDYQRSVSPPVTASYSPSPPATTSSSLSPLSPPQAAVPMPPLPPPPMPPPMATEVAVVAPIRLFEIMRMEAPVEVPVTTPASIRKSVYDLPCAVELQGAGIKFKGILIEGEKSLLDIKFENRHELLIPQLIVGDDAEVLLRNIIALEQCIYQNDALVCNYVELMDFLINTVEDVDFLAGNQIVGIPIISNHVGDNASVANLFNSLTHNITLSSSTYHDICEQLKDHYKNPWNRSRATLKNVYFNNLWRGTATIAAIILLLLTIVQTICSILQVM